MDDNELMLRVRAGDKDAYEMLIKKYMKQAKAFAFQYVHDSYAAEDIVQESFADIYIQRFEFDQRYKFSTYLFSIVKNKARNYLRKNRKIAMCDFEEETEEPVLRQKFIAEDTPETIYFKKAELQELQEAIKGLKEDERNILYLYAVEDCSYKEIAARLGQSLAMVTYGLSSCAHNYISAIALQIPTIIFGIVSSLLFMPHFAELTQGVLPVAVILWACVLAAVLGNVVRFLSIKLLGRL